MKKMQMTFSENKLLKKEIYLRNIKVREFIKIARWPTNPYMKK